MIVNCVKLVMLLLREPSQALRMDAFHVFKIFVANPNKSDEVKQVLLRNREKLLTFVSDFGKQELSLEFHQERSLLVFTLQRMGEQEARRAAAAAASASRGMPTVAKDAGVNGVVITTNSVQSEVCAHQD